MKNILEIAKFVVITALLAVIGFGFLKSYQTQTRNQAINDCYNQSFYRTQYIENGKTIDTSETQKYIYLQCLKDKNVSVSSR